METIKELQRKIQKLKKEKNAVILVHNYQREEIQQVADFLGDSLGLSKKAKDAKENIIVFCGVTFMAETAKILSPQKTVLVPRTDVPCPMARMVTSTDIKLLKQRYPDAEVVCYVNTTADVKAECDVCCTSANAVKVVKNIPSKKVIFVPDMNLGNFVMKKNPDKEVILWDGFCYTHRKFSSREIEKIKSRYPDSKVIVHPECDPDVVEMADSVESTSGMVRIARESNIKRFIIGTEEGLIWRLRRENPDKEFTSLGPPRICYNMKRITLEDVYNSLLEERYQVELPEDIVNRAQKALEEMLKYI